MKRISFNPRFVNEAGNDLIPGKIHTIRQNYDWWKKFEGKEVALFTWEGKPYQKGSKQKVFCVKKIVSVQEVFYGKIALCQCFTQFEHPTVGNRAFDKRIMARNDGFNDVMDFDIWFMNYKPGKMGILHFTDFRY